MLLLKKINKKCLCATLVLVLLFGLFNFINMLYNFKQIENKKLLVHLHLYYVDQTDYFIEQLSHITIPYDLYVTVMNDNDQINKRFRALNPNVHILKVPDRGYDVYPFYLALQEVNLDDYDYVLKLHTKSFKEVPACQRFCYEGYEWRNKLVEPLIGSSFQLKRALSLLNEDQVGMVSSLFFISYSDTYLAEILDQIHEMNRQMNISINDTPYSMGTMFLVRSRILKKFKEYPFQLDDFEDIHLSNIGYTKAHMLERTFGHMVGDAGYESVGILNVGNYFLRLSQLYQYFLPNGYFKYLFNGILNKNPPESRFMTPNRVE